MVVGLCDVVVGLCEVVVGLCEVAVGLCEVVVRGAGTLHTNSTQRAGVVYGDCVD